MRLLLRLEEKQKTLCQRSGESTYSLCVSYKIAMVFTYTMELSEAKLQQKVSAMMPLQKKKYFFTVMLSEPVIELIEGNNQMGIFIHIEVVGPKGISGNGKAKIVGSLSYKPEQSEFFFKNPTIEKMEIDNIQQKYISRVKSIIQSVARKMLATRPIYTLKDTNLKHKLAKSMLQTVAVKDKKLLLELKVL